jgi:hypothetical protein
VDPALERRFSSSVTDMEGRFRVVLADKDAQVQVAQEGYAQLLERLTGFQAQLESAKAEAETLVSESSGAADHWRNKVRAGRGGADLWLLEGGSADGDALLMGGLVGWQAEELEAEVSTLRAASQRAEEQATVAQRTIQVRRGPSVCSPCARRDGGWACGNRTGCVGVAGAGARSKL